jgi:hypothetical protein
VYFGEAIRDVARLRRVTFLEAGNFQEGGSDGPRCPRKAIDYSRDPVYNQFAQSWLTLRKKAGMALSPESLLVQETSRIPPTSPRPGMRAESAISVAGLPKVGYLSGALDTRITPELRYESNR